MQIRLHKSDPAECPDCGQPLDADGTCSCGYTGSAVAKDADGFVPETMDRRTPVDGLIKSYWSHLHKARDVSGEARIPKGQPHGGEWTALETLLPWGEPRRLQTAQGERILQTAPADEAFWNLWRAGKDTLKAAGISVGKNPRTGSWEVGWWRPIPAEEEKAKEKARKASAATSARVTLPHPEGMDYLPFQKAGIKYALARPNVLIADEMGLGKTIQAIGIANADKSVKRVLVIARASLKINWEREWKKWGTRGLSVGVAGKEWPDTDVVITNYDILSKWQDKTHKTPWDMLVCDEAHYLKTPTALRTKMVLGHTDKKTRAVMPPITARRRVMLTGTPIVSRPAELWNLVTALDPQGLGKDFWQFHRRYTNAHNNGFGWDFSGAANLPELQDRLRESVMVRRLKKDVLKELPPKTRQVVTLPADDPKVRRLLLREKTYRDEFGDEIPADLYEENRAATSGIPPAAKAKRTPKADYAEQVEDLRTGESPGFGEISKMRHELAVLKIPYVIEHVQAMREDGIDKILVFAHHKDVVDALMSAFGAEAVKVTGDDSQPDRQVAVDRFQKDPGVHVFVGNIQAAGVGLTLTAAQHVVFAELPWTPGEASQAEDRAHRIGQVGNVQVQHLVFDGSLDAKMAQTIVDKQSVIDRALDTKRAPTAPRKPEVTGIEIARTPEPREKATTDRKATTDKKAEAPSGTILRIHLPPTPPATVPAAEAVTAATYDRKAWREARMSAEQVEAVHRMLRELHSNNADRAQQKNGVGFNGMDTEIGGSLAESPTLTPSQARLGLKIVLKYHGQVGYVPGFEPEPPARGTRLRLHKARDVSGEARVPGGQHGGGEWTASASSRPTYPGGRLIPQIGDKVYQQTAGFMGMGAIIQGEVVTGTGGKRVKITGSRAVIGSVRGVGRTIPLDATWIVVGDPHEVAKKEKADAERRAIEDEIAQTEARQEARRIASKGQGFKHGDVIDHVESPGRPAVVEHDPDYPDYLSGHNLESDPMTDSPVTLGVPYNWRKLSPAEVRALPAQQRARIKEVASGKALAARKAVEAAYQAELAQEDAKRHSPTNIYKLMRETGSNTFGEIRLGAETFKITMVQEDTSARCVLVAGRQKIKMPVYLGATGTLSDLETQLRGSVVPEAQIHVRAPSSGIAKAMTLRLHKGARRDVSGESRVPGGQHGGGEWTTGAAVGAPVGGGHPPTPPEETARAHAAGIKVPPTTWGLVINPDPNARMRAKWFDKAGRSQAAYSDEATSARTARKFDNLLRFAKALPRIRRKIAADISRPDTSIERACAAILAIIDQTTMRVGSEKYSEENGTYGASSLRKTHVFVHGNTIRCTFPGKHHVDHDKVAEGKPLADALRAFAALPGDRMFQAAETPRQPPVPVTERHVRDYLAPFGVTPKEFRTFHATRMAAELLTHAGPPPDEKTARKTITEVCRKVSEHLGNTPAMARSSYIDPAVIEAYSKGRL